MCGLQSSACVCVRMYNLNCFACTRRLKSQTSHHLSWCWLWWRAVVYPSCAPAPELDRPPPPALAWSGQAPVRVHGPASPVWCRIRGCLWQPYSRLHWKHLLRPAHVCTYVCTENGKGESCRQRKQFKYFDQQAFTDVCRPLCIHTIVYHILGILLSSLHVVYN